MKGERSGYLSSLVQAMRAVASIVMSHRRYPTRRAIQDSGGRNRPVYHLVWADIMGVRPSCSYWFYRLRLLISAYLNEIWCDPPRERRITESFRWSGVLYDV